MSEEPLILVTNDDGIFSKGIQSLVEVAQVFGKVVVVSPDSAQSGMGHAITISQPLRLQKNTSFKGIEAYSCSGTPVDCVKLAIYEVLHRKPDLLVSGINHGANTSTNVLYSGTMSAAVEGAMESIPSIGFSLYDFDADADFTASQEVARKVIQKVLHNGIKEGTCLNVNIPKLSPNEIKGIKMCKQAHAFWTDRFDKREDAFGRPYYWMAGEFTAQDDSEDTDLNAIAEGYASIVPTQFDLTDFDMLKEWKI